jgi:hypothetical protein
MKNLVNQAMLICLFSFALYFAACDKKDQNDSKSLSASSNPVLQKHASGSRSDSLGSEVSYYMLYLYQQGGDTSKLMQARRGHWGLMVATQAVAESVAH